VEWMTGCKYSTAEGRWSTRELDEGKWSLACAPLGMTRCKSVKSIRVLEVINNIAQLALVTGSSSTYTYTGCDLLIGSLHICMCLTKFALSFDETVLNVHTLVL